MTNDLFQVEAVCYLPVKGGDKFPVTKEFYQKAKDTYKNVDVKQQLMEMDMWLVSNPSKQKTKRGMTKFINGWLSRSSKAPIVKQDNRQSFQSLHDNVRF